jgi:inorganic triphosphatase YgiF
MPQETELKLSLLPQDLPRLLAHPLLSAHRPARQRLLNTYFDTPDLLLMQQRVAVRERRIGRRTLLTVKTAGKSVGGLSTRGEWEGPTRPGDFDFAALVDDAALAASLMALAWRLVPLFRTDFIRRTWLLDFAGAQIEVALDQGSISVGQPASTPGTPHGVRRLPVLELELELKRGPVQALMDLAHRLALGPDGSATAGLWLHPFHRSKAERGLDLFLGRRAQPSKSDPLVLSPGMTPVQAFQRAALGCLAHLQANVSGYLAALDTDGFPDPEYLHQARVSLRRLRTGLALFRSVLPRRFVGHWQRHWQAIGASLGDARNWDVLDAELVPDWLGQAGAGGDTDALAQWVRAQRRRANEGATRRLREPAYAVSLLAFTRALMALPADSPRSRPADMAPWARRRVRALNDRLASAARRSPGHGVPGIHALRIQLKKARYGMEWLASVLPADRVRQSTALLNRGQALLGSFNDLQTARELLAPCPQALAERLRQDLGQEQERLLRQMPALERRLLRATAAWD